MNEKYTENKGCGRVAEQPGTPLFSDASRSGLVIP